MTTAELNFYSQFPLLYNNLTTIITSANLSVLDVGCNDWSVWWFTNAYELPYYYTQSNVLTSLSATAISRPLTEPTIIDPDVVFMNVPVNIPGIPTSTKIVYPSPYYLKTPGYSFTNYFEVPVGDDIVSFTTTQQPTTNLLILTSITTAEKKSLIDAYKLNANYIYVENIVDFQSGGWSWYWDYLQLNFNILSDGTNGLISSK